MEDPDINDGSKECPSSSSGGPSRGRELRVCSGGSPVHRPAVAVRVKGEPRVVGGIANTIEQAKRQTTRASVKILEAGVAATAHMRVAEHTGVEAEPLPEVLAQ